MWSVAIVYGIKRVLFGVQFSDFRNKKLIMMT